MLTPEQISSAEQNCITLRELLLDTQRIVDAARIRNATMGDLLKYESQISAIKDLAARTYCLRCHDGRSVVDCLCTKLHNMPDMVKANEQRA